MNVVFKELSKNYPKLAFIEMEAEEFPEISEELEIETVPTFIVLKNEKIVDKVEGANAPQLTTLAKKYASLVPSDASTTTTTSTGADAPSPQALEQKLKTLVNSYPVMLFMKGTPSQPKCGFSRQTVEILEKVNCTYGSFDILADDQVRQGLKTFSDWPTFPQLYINGELVGGLDILKELVESGEFEAMLPQEDDLETRLKKLINKAPVMLFMKGDRTQPRCGFSRTIVGLLLDQQVEFETFDILQDEEVRQGLKTFSDWPTFPQLYIKGELVGGLDIVKEMIENGEFKEMLA